MLNFLKRKPTPETSSEAESLVTSLSKEDGRIYPFHLKNFPTGLKIQDAGPEVQRLVALALFAWIDHNRPQPGPGNRTDWRRYWLMQNTLFSLLKRRLPFAEEDLLYILDRSVRQNSNYSRGIPQMIKVTDNYLKEAELSEPLRAQIIALVQAIRNTRRLSVQERRWVMRLRELAGDTDIHLPLVKGDVWAEAVLTYIQSKELDLQTTWAELLMHCLRVSGSRPSKKWMKEAEAYITSIGWDEYRARLLEWFPRVSEPRLQPAGPYEFHRNDPNMVWYLEAANSDILKGLVWTCSQSEDSEMAHALSALALTAYKKIPGVGPRAGKIGNACFWALGEMPADLEGIAQLSILKLRIKANPAQKAIAKALESASKRVGIGADEIEELSVPDYGMQEVGVRREEFEGYTFELKVNGSDLEQVWRREDTKIVKSVPKVVREKYPEELKAIKQAVKDTRKMLTAQRDRIDNLYLAQKKWDYGVWRERYIEHPLVGTIARRLIWKFSKDDHAASGIWHEGQFVERNGRLLSWLDENTKVELWHPINVDSDVVLEWRNWLAEHKVQQPFKQAHREVYILTEAELNTRVYSNRYAAHILRQHQFNALCAARGWKNSLRLMVDDYFPPAVKQLPSWNLRAEYWIEGIGDNYGTDTNATGTYLYVTTDQVRFYSIDAFQNSAHAGGGGYQTVRWNRGAESEPLPLEQIPPLVFSEIMRDVDMFVGVASLGNDPNWLDGGPEVRYRDYWHSYSFGELTESAKTRKQVLEMVVPRLKIAERCKLTDKFLVVRGDIRTYKIHLGSGNILMEPNDQYLCIVPSRGGELGKDQVFLPFEGDQTLAVILSKAFLLAEDKKITDSTITRQLKR